jgi:lactate dehydrogenase-like 2-hydroxyacid dehydrogenase
LSGIKIIGRGGVGMDNIDVDYAKAKGFTLLTHLPLHQNLWLN